MTSYSLSVLEALCMRDIAGRLPWHELRPDGLYLARHGQEVEASEQDVIEWHPWRDPERPALPVPFTARDLAAFMLAGGGYFLLEAFVQQGEVTEGDSDAAPPWPRPLDEAALARLGPNGDRPREAMRAAHDLLLEASGRFGRDPEDLNAAAEWLLRAVGEAPIRSKAVPKMLDNERRVRDAIRDELKARGFAKIPAWKVGNKPDPFKEAVEKRCGLPGGAFKHAWNAVTKGERPPKRPRGG